MPRDLVDVVIFDFSLLCYLLSATRAAIVHLPARCESNKHPFFQLFWNALQNNIVCILFDTLLLLIEKVVQDFIDEVIYKQRIQNGVYFALPPFLKQLAPCLGHPADEHLYNFLRRLDLSCSDNDPTRVVDLYYPCWFSDPIIGDPCSECPLPQFWEQVCRIFLSFVIIA